MLNGFDNGSLDGLRIEPGNPGVRTGSKPLPADTSVHLGDAKAVFHFELFSGHRTSRSELNQTCVIIMHERDNFQKSRHARSELFH